ncbi:fatty acid metabolism transcriptional regulator FadR [[Haemophilus] ducreyi]|nr:fatty acid metabolism transcriptional regulator FadR [[Haemophilus] ducreyi]AKO31345.1 fatty acid metabolism regulator protein [[Haemophilus] ducreyi]AKO32796.1 fatty acid metabolism regulator protein [[Haemophilus] ducreyi]AKO34245.1 fatty acid metabolism regulator protein [[Haemophilus] ducreyi]AKO35688.1 fatty acid metabolism regulator protein [[Haemophilus] ducreyi]AKO37150.1 fatty acid metabolism regulator protein [[Haemophilus] ducreyi]
MDNTYILKARSPAALAEEYIVRSIWDKRFPAGSDLPAERELADKIGVTRTTLREVLQRLARDGWLNIQHGKPTKVNDVWETAGPNIISTLIKLDKSYIPVIIANVVSLRTRMAESYIPEAIKLNPAQCCPLFAQLDTLEDTAEAYATFDYNLFRQLTFLANKPVYALILNSFKQMYHQVANLFFADPTCRQLSLSFYRLLLSACVEENHEKAIQVLVDNRQLSSEIWVKLLQTLPEQFGV